MSNPISEVAEAQFPVGSELEKYDDRRQTRGRIWYVLFLASTMVGIVALTALLYNIINSAFGYVAYQNTIDPDTLVQQVEKTRLLGAPDIVSSEDDIELADGLAQASNGVGFLGFAYYEDYADTLRLLAIDGVEPSLQTVNSGEYSLARPLYIYTTEDAIRENSSIAAFVSFYVEHVNNVIEEVGYYPAAPHTMADTTTRLAALLEDADPEAVQDGEPIQIAGSSTVFPLTMRLINEFQKSSATSSFEVDSIGTGAGFARFCDEGASDIVNASRRITRAEVELCAKKRRTPVELRVGTDALAVVASPDTTFVESVSIEELSEIFTTDGQWSDVNSTWPDVSIQRFVPGADSGTLDFFVATLFDRQLADLSKPTLIGLLEANVSSGLMRRFEHEQPFAERTDQNVLQLVQTRVVEPKIVDTWSLTDSIFRRAEIEATVAQIESGDLQFRNWVNMSFVSGSQSSKPEEAGIRTAIFGSLWVIVITILFSLPLGVGAAIYLEEYAQQNWLNDLIETNINNLAGVPSIIYGMLGLAIFVRVLEAFTSGALFGAADPTTANGRTVISAGLTLGLLILPLIIINAREAIRAVPGSLRQASYGLGATRWQTIWNHVLPNALSGILTGTILAISRAIGETAPLVVVGASTFIVVDPSGPFSKFTTLPIQIYQWTSRPQDEFRNLAAAAIVVLLVLLLTLNATAVILRNRFSTQRT